MMSNNSSNVRNCDRGNKDERNNKPTEQKTRRRGNNHDGIQSPLKLTCTLCEEVILAVDVDHAIL